MADATLPRPRPRRLGAVLLALAPALAWSACPPLDTPFGADPPGAALRPQPLALALDGPRVLLGLHGERVPADTRLIAVPEDGDLAPRIWPDAVDWSVYASRAGEPGATVLQRDAEGRLCRIDRYRLQRGRQIEDGGYRLAYDAEGRLAGYAEYASARDRGGALQQACVRRDAKGRVTAVFQDGCSATPERPVYYVRDDAGALLRIIDQRAGPLGTLVHRLNPDGTTRAVYRSRPDPDRDGALIAYAVPPAQEDRILPVAPGTSPVITTEIPDEPWRLVRVPADTVEGDGLPSWDPKVQTVLLKGLSNARGQVVLEAGQIAPFHQALRETPGRVLLYVHEMTRFLPVTALDAQAWKRCIDPARRDAGACD
ncbi:hypothetical protein [Achromobacter xylosoxidans]|uniref:hypothetical protein n=1 Tax=Alcaligenes xylosoxydans xylosoxydans TaxID=85698 RepID=UPI001F35AD1D|nr:hypothetical protein [Achromobacter xylosoxidans]MCH4579320.1 hypothetical protein [Achromobacter xylosoxidans]